MEYDHIKLTRDELEYVLEILQYKLEHSEPSEALDVADIITVIREPIKKERRAKATEWHHNKQKVHIDKYGSHGCGGKGFLEYCKHLDKVFLRYLKGD